jgi:proteasome lid subunit RPN8/RPN11
MSRERTRLTIAARVIADMLAHGREEAPRECCGLLIGTSDAIVRSVRARNLDDKHTRYLIDPADHFAAVRAARADGLDVVGAYHSHPSTAAVPSPADVREATGGSEFLYVIVSVKDDDVRGYQIADGNVVSIPHRVV